MSHLINPFYYLNTQPNWFSCGLYNSEGPCVSTQSSDTKNRMFCVATDPLTLFDLLHFSCAVQFRINVFEILVQLIWLYFSTLKTHRFKVYTVLNSHPVFMYIYNTSSILACQICSLVSFLVLQTTTVHPTLASVLARRAPRSSAAIIHKMQRPATLSE